MKLEDSTLAWSKQILSWLGMVACVLRPAFGRPKQEECKLKASLGYTAAEQIKTRNNWTEYSKKKS